MRSLYSGVATIDKRLQIARADKRFYEYIGFENYVALTNIIHPEDIGRFREVVAGLAEGEASMLAVRLRRADGEYHYMLTQLLGVPVKLDGEPYIELRVQDVSSMEENLAFMSDESNINSEFLDLWGEYLFRYDAARDFFRIFSGGILNRIYLFQGTLREFEQTMLQRALVGEGYCADFQELCADIRRGAGNFEYRLLFLDPSVDPKSDIHIVQGRTIKNAKNEPVVLGCISCRSGSNENGECRQKKFERDAATGLIAKRAIIEYAENLLRRGPKYNVHFCIVDIDNFKQVNDTLGHLYGDRVLAEIADILKEAVAGKGLVGRIGGDEMFVLLEGVSSLDNLRGILRSIRSNVEWTYKGRRGVPPVTCSIGVSAWPDDAKSYEDLFKIADRMLYRAKEKGKNRYIVYAPEVHGDVLSESDTAAGIKKEGERQDREELLLRLLECLARQQKQPFGAILENIGYAFGLDEVRLFYRGGEKVLMNGCWSEERGVRNEGNSMDFVYEENFLHLCKGRRIAVVDRTSLIEQLCPQTWRYLTDCGAKAALIYKMNFTHHEGFICYSRMSESSRKWSDSDRENLTYISKVLELLINDK